MSRWCCTRSNYSGAVGSRPCSYRSGSNRTKDRQGMPRGMEANKAANQANGVTEKAYVDQCRGGAAPAQTTAAPSAPRPCSAPQRLRGQKTAKACREEWQANKAANQANGVTEKAYVAQCRGGAAPAQTTAAPAAPPAPAPHRSGYADKRPPRHAERNGRANKAANQANGVTEKAYVDQCRSGAAPAQTTAAPPAPAPAPTAAPAAPAPAPTAAAPPARPAPHRLNRQNGPHRSGKSRWGERIFNRSAS